MKLLSDPEDNLHSKLEKKAFLKMTKQNTVNSPALLHSEIFSLGVDMQIINVYTLFPFMQWTVAIQISHLTIIKNQ